MTWTKLGDEFSDECWTLTDAAHRLHVDGLVWSNRKGTDGQLAKDDMPRWAKRPEAAEELVSIGWWEDRGQHYQIIHHIGYQRTAEEIAHQSIVNRANRAKGKARPVRPKSDSLNESSDESSDERDRTGQARTGTGRAPKKNEQPPNNNEPVCARCEGWVAMSYEAGPADNPEWCRGCNDDARADAARADGWRRQA
jgi:hypothetical protein